MGGSEHDAQLVGGEHHRDAGAGERREHLGVAGKIESSGEKGGLVERSGDDSGDAAGRRESNRTLDGQPGEPAGDRGAAAAPPFADFLADIEPDSIRPDHHNVTALANPGVGERLDDNFWTDAAGIAGGDSKRLPVRHRYNRTDT